MWSRKASRGEWRRRGNRRPWGAGAKPTRDRPTDFLGIGSGPRKCLDQRMGEGKHANISNGGLRRSVDRTHRRAIIATVLSAMVMSCAPHEDSANREECLSWRGVRYCFPSKNLVAMSANEEQGSIDVRIPLAAPELRHCNARSSEVDRIAYDYDNVDVGLASLSDRVTPAEIYNQQLAFRLGTKAPPLKSAGKVQCWRNPPGTNGGGWTCLERDAADNQIYATTCTEPDGVGNPACSDLTISRGFILEIHADLPCYTVRRSMRRHVKQYLDAHRSEDRRRNIDTHSK